MKLVILIALFSIGYCCDLSIHVKSATQKKFYVQVTTPNGHRSERLTFGRNREQQTYQQNQNECAQGDWTLESYNDSGVLVNTVRVNLDGTGFVTYNVDDDLTLVQVQRQGAICTGQCADLGSNESRNNERGNNGGIGAVKTHSRTLSGINH